MLYPTFFPNWSFKMDRSSIRIFLPSIPIGADHLAINMVCPIYINFRTLSLHNCWWKAILCKIKLRYVKSNCTVFTKQGWTSFTASARPPLHTFLSVTRLSHVTIWGLHPHPHSSLHRIQIQTFKSLSARFGGMGHWHVHYSAHTLIICKLHNRLGWANPLNECLARCKNSRDGRNNGNALLMVLTTRYRVVDT